MGAGCVGVGGGLLRARVEDDLHGRYLGDIDMGIVASLIIALWALAVELESSHAHVPDGFIARQKFEAQSFPYGFVSLFPSR